MGNKNGVVTHAIFHLITIVFCVFTTVPFILTIMVSISDENSVIKQGYRFIPEKLSADAYKLIFASSEVYNAYTISILVTIIGTVLSLLITSLLGYAIAVQKVKYRNFIALLVFIPMIFNAGLVPWYIVLTKYLHLKDSLMALILPMLVSPFNVFLVRNYYKSLPPSLIEAAEIEGANPLYVFAKIVLPLSTPITATITLFYALAYWNDWNLALWLIDDQKLYPLQFMLFKIQSMINYMATHSGYGTGQSTLPSVTAQMAMVLVTIGPIIVIYPYVQKYFIKGIMIGAIKG